MKFISSLRFQRRKIRCLGQFGGLIIAFTLFGCSPNLQLISCSLPELAPEAAARLKQVDAIQFSILMDGTLSMQGYVNDLVDSRYNKTIKLIDSASSTGWNSVTTQYYRFGTKKQPINRETFLKAQLPAFYQSSNDFITSRIDAALMEPADNKLNLIVTDLYQKDADVRLVQNLLAQRYLSKGYNVGILAVKSEFKGTIYDVGITNQNFDYSTLGKKDQALRPFYVILLGTYGNINHFYDQLQRNGLSTVEHEFIIFSPRPVEQPATLDTNDVKLTFRKDIIQSKALNDGQVLVRKKKSNDPVQFWVVTQKTEAKPMTMEIPYRGLRGVLPIEPNTITLASQIEKYQRQSKNFQPSEVQAFKLTDWKISNQSLEFNTTLQPDQLDSGIYRFTFDALPVDFTEPSWWNTWNATEGNLDGAKTHNLLPFLRGLRLRTAELMKQQKPIIARLCYAVQKK